MTANQTTTTTMAGLSASESSMSERWYICENENCRHRVLDKPWVHGKGMGLTFVKDVIGYRCPKCNFSLMLESAFPQSRGTTSSELLQMHDAAENKPKAPLEKEIRSVCLKMAEFLVEKNRAYGNSAANPCRVFAKRADALLSIDVRIDDKINRLMNGSEFPGDDTVKDLAGYLLLRMIVAEQELTK